MTHSKDYKITCTCHYAQTYGSVVGETRACWPFRRWQKNLSINDTFHITLAISYDIDLFQGCRKRGAGGAIKLLNQPICALIFNMEMNIFYRWRKFATASDCLAVQWATGKSQRNAQFAKACHMDSRPSHV